MHHTESLFDKAYSNTQDTQCQFDMHNKLIALVDNQERILGVLRFELIDGGFAKIETVATAADRKGYGYRLYLAALAALGPAIQFIPDVFQYSDGCLSIWYQLFVNTNVVKSSLKGTQHYQSELDSRYSHELARFNPYVISEQWDVWELANDIYTHVDSGKLNSHPSNLSFRLTEHRRTHIAQTLIPCVYTSPQISALNECLELDYERLGSPKAERIRQGRILPMPSKHNAI